MNRRHILFSLLLILYCGSGALFAQKAADKKKSAKKGPYAIVSQWDKNKDGLLQTSEIPEQARSKVLSGAKARGLDVKKPIEIKALFARGGKTGGKTGGKAGGKAGSEDKAARKLDRGIKKSADAKKAAVAKSNTANAKGFGQKATRDRASGFDQSESKSGASDEEGLTKKQRAARKRLAPVAKSVMFQRDKNRNGRLDKNEWKGMGGEPWLSDRDRDGSLSMSELTDHLGDFGSREKDVTARSRAKKKNRRSATGKDGKKLSYRFLTPHERLPKELPAWWVDLDANEDGQLTLREYAKTMSSSKVEKFMQFDLNRDGMLVAKEYLKATE